MQQSKVQPAYHLVFSGSGARFISFVGALRCLKEIPFPDLLNNIKSVTGSSGGALIGTAVGLGYSISFIEKLCMSMNWNDMMNVDVNSFLISYGLDDGSNFVRLFQALIERKLGSAEATFADFYTATGRVLNITATNISKMSPVVFNHMTEPDMQIWKALRITMSIPLLFTAVKHGADFFVDGALLNAFPVEVCFEGPAKPALRDTIIGINLEHIESSNDVVDIVTYIKALTNTLGSRLHAKDYSKLGRVDNLLLLRLRTAHRSAFDLDISAVARSALYNQAYEQTKHILTDQSMIVRLLVRKIFAKFHQTE